MLNRLMSGPLREGEPEGGGGGFDPVKFKTEILAEFNKGLNGALKNFRKEIKPEGDPKPEPDGEGEPDEQKPGQKATDPRMSKLEREIAKMREEREADRKALADERTKARNEKLNSTLRTELLKHVPAERVESAMRIFGPDVKYDEDGHIVGGADETSLAEFVTSEIQKHEYLLPPKQVGGAGATAGSTGRGAKAFDTAQIRPGMTAEEKSAAYANIGAIFQARNQ